MSFFQAIIYGIVQGIAEFLPISSSAHLIAIPKLLGWSEPGLAFDVALHVGTLIAIITFFWHDWIDLIGSGFSRPSSTNGKLFWYIVISTIPGAIIGKLLESQAEEAFRNLTLVGSALIIMGIILYLADKSKRQYDSLKDIGLFRSLIIGLSQALAIIPGVSRSGITMSTGLFCGLKKDASARFSFLLSTPIIVGAALLKMKDIIHTSIYLPSFVVAVLTSALVGFFSIKFLLNYLKRKGFGIFVVYRLVFGSLLIAVSFLR